MFNQSSSTLHNAIIRSSSGVKVCQIDMPRIRSNEMLLAPLVVGLCGTDIQILRGERHEPAAIIGHEGIAKIVQVGPCCQTNLKPGDLVLVNPTHPRDSSFLLGHNIDGMFQEYIRIPASAIAAELLIPVNETFPLKLAPLVEPLAVVLYAFELLALEHREGAIIIYGDGIIGHLTLLLARIKFGYSRPLMFVHHTQEGLNWSLSHHIHADVDFLFNDLLAKKEIQFDMATAIIATPRSSTLHCLNHAVEHISANGAIDIIGGLPDNANIASLPNIDLVKIRAANCGGFPKPGVFRNIISAQNKPLTLFGHRGVSNTHLLQAIIQLEQHHAIFSKLISHMLDLEEAAKFMHHLFQHGMRQIDGERVMKMGIRVHAKQEELQLTTKQ
jgi:threonine dehydrogenase-like Zn-dependent dehydrogenase